MQAAAARAGSDRRKKYTLLLSAGCIFCQRIILPGLRLLGGPSTSDIIIEWTRVSRRSSLPNCSAFFAGTAATACRGGAGF